VFTNKDDAIKLIREKKGGRFKAFSSRVEAEEFSKNVFVSSCLTQANETNEPARPVPSEDSSFRSVKIQVLLVFRQAIEAEDAILKLVWSYPRYLTGSGDNPSILYEGCRYNALHSVGDYLNSCTIKYYVNSKWLFRCTISNSGSNWLFKCYLNRVPYRGFLRSDEVDELRPTGLKVRRTTGVPVAPGLRPRSRTTQEMPRRLRPSRATEAASRRRRKNRHLAATELGTMPGRSSTPMSIALRAAAMLMTTGSSLQVGSSESRISQVADPDACYKMSPSAGVRSTRTAAVSVIN